MEDLDTIPIGRPLARWNYSQEEWDWMKEEGLKQGNKEFRGIAGTFLVPCLIMSFFVLYYLFFSGDPSNRRVGVEMLEFMGGFVILLVIVFFFFWYAGHSMWGTRREISINPESARIRRKMVTWDLSTLRPDIITVKGRFPRFLEIHPLITRLDRVVLHREERWYLEFLFTVGKDNSSIKPIGSSLNILVPPRSARDRNAG